MYKEAPIYNIRERSLKFSVQMIQLIRTFPKDTSGFAIGNQIIRSGTSIGANIEEAQNCGSKKEFIHTMTIALKEARETEYWLIIVNEVKLAEEDLVTSLLCEVNQLIKVLTSIIKKTKLNSRIAH